LLFLGPGLLAIFLLIQLLQYGRDHTNPPLLAEPAWDSPKTRALVQRACFDCHSNETVWPWYSNIAPISWLVQRDVDRGREKINFSAWGQGEDHSEHAYEMVTEGKMPLSVYLLAHPEARFTSAEQDALIAGILATFGREEEGEHDIRNTTHE
jgi:hypothetical protein